MSYIGNSGVTAPASDMEAVTPGTPFSKGLCRALYVGTGGDVNIELADGTTVLFASVPVGVLPVRCKGVATSSTTASNIVALY